MKTYISYIIFLVVISACQFKKMPADEVNQPAQNAKPVYHFTPPAEWMNDPNGMVYYAGEYHLFYQHYPDSNVWGPMHWGHAVSKDMLHWEHLPIALYPDSLGFIFSGSAVVDHANTSGFGSAENPPMVAIYTYSNQQEEFKGSITFQNQAVAYSLDSGRTWVKYDQNPVITNPGIKDFRDPKVTWMEEFDKWVMILAVKDHVSIYSSKNLIDWTHESDFGKNIGAHGGVWECPDLFKIKDDQGNWRWVMLVSINPGGPQGGSGTQYFVGDFDGHKFSTTQNKVKWVDYGADNYAGVLWSNIPETDGRHLFIGWMNNWAYANKISLVDRNNMMTLPREVTLLNNGGDFLLNMKPVKEANSILAEAQNITVRDIQAGFKTDLAYKLEIEMEPTKNPFELIFTSSYGDSLSLIISSEKIELDRSKCGDTSLSNVFSNTHEVDIYDLHKLSIYIDRSSIEVFVNDGMWSLTDLFFTSSPLSNIYLNSPSPTDNWQVKYHPIVMRSPI